MVRAAIFLSGSDKLVLGCFFDLKLGSVAGHVPKSSKKYRIVGIRRDSVKFVQFRFKHKHPKSSLPEKKC